MLVLAIKGNSAYAPDLLRDTQKITSELRRLSGIRRVDSVATVPLIRRGLDGRVELSAAIEDGVVRDGRDWDAVRRALSEDRIARDNLVSEDGTVFAVNAFLYDDVGARYEETVDRVVGIAEEYNAMISGVPLFRVETNRRTVREICLFIPLTVGVILVLLLVVSRDVRSALVPLIAGGIGTLVVSGMMGGMGVPFTLTTMILPTILLALGCAYGMHILVAAGRANTDEELSEKLSAVAWPVALSALTTSLGLGAMCLVEIEAIRLVGMFGGVGVAVVFLAAVTIGPALYSLIHGNMRKAGRIDSASARFGRFLAEIAVRRRLIVCAGWTGFLVVMLICLFVLRVETDVTRWFAEDTSVRRSYESIRRLLAGISPMNFVVHAPSGMAVTRPEVFEALSRFEKYIEKELEVGSALSIASPVQELNGAFRGHVGGAVPEKQSLIEQYLLLLDSASQTRDLVTPDRGAANVLLRVDDNSSAHLLWVAEAANEWWRTNGPGGFRGQMTGIMYEFARAGDEIARGQVRALLVAAVVVSAVVFLLFGSLRVAAIAMIPNIIPVIGAFGVMGLLGVRLDAGTVLIGNLALGIAVDDTIHIVSSYRYRVGEDMGEGHAISGALREVFPAISLTTGVVGVGFLVLGLSDFTFVENLGLVTAAVMGLCLAADSTLLPALLGEESLA